MNAGPQRWRLLVPLALLAGCDSEPHAAAGDDRPANVVVEAILERCHGARRGTFDRAQLELKRRDAGRTATVSLQLPERMRVDWSSGEHLVVDGDGASAWRVGEPSRALSGDELAEAVRMRDLVAMLVLQPLENARESERTGLDRIVLTDGGRRQELVYDASDDVPRSLGGDAGTVVFDRMKDTGRLRVPERVTLGPLGSYLVRIVDTGFRFQDAFFAPPAETAPPPDVQIGGVGSPIPRRVDTEACSWLLVPDPGDWAGRLRTYAEAGERLGPAGYTNAGDPLLLEEDGVAWFVIPYLPDAPDPRPVEPREGEQVREVGAHAVVSVHPEDGEFEARVAAGRAAVEEYLDEHGLSAAGPPRSIVNLFNVRPEADPRALQTVPLEIAVPVEKRE